MNRGEPGWIYCGSCGQQNQQNAVFCQKCGQKLIRYRDLTGDRNVPVMVQKPSKIPKMIALTELCLLVVCLVAAGMTVRKSFSLERTAKRYVMHMANNEYDKAFEMLDVKKSDFISKKMYKMVNQDVYRDVVDRCYINYKDQGSQAAVTADLIYQGENGSDHLTFVMDNEKKNLLFDNWKVNADNMILPYKLVVPSGSTVTVDDVELDQSYKVSSEGGVDSHDTYQIPEIFAGIHTVSVSQDGMGTATSLQYVSEAGESSCYYLEQLPLSEETMQQMVQQLASCLEQFMKAAMIGEPYESVAGLFSSTMRDAERIKQFYQELADGYQHLQDWKEDDILWHFSFTNIQGMVDENDDVMLRGDLQYTMDDVDPATGEPSSSEIGECDQVELKCYMEWEENQWRIDDFGLVDFFETDREPNTSYKGYEYQFYD